MQQDPAELVRAHAVLNALEGLLLRGIEFEFERAGPGFYARDVEFGGLFDDFDEAALDQRVQSVLRGTSSELSRSTSARPPAIVSASIKVCWFALSFARRAGTPVARSL